MNLIILFCLLLSIKWWKWTVSKKSTIHHSYHYLRTLVHFPLCRVAARSAVPPFMNWERATSQTTSSTSAAELAQMPFIHCCLTFTLERLLGNSHLAIQVLLTIGVQDTASSSFGKIWFFTFVVIRSMTLPCLYILTTPAPSRWQRNAEKGRSSASWKRPLSVIYSAASPRTSYTALS